ncbi:uncharacterized protein LOC134252300 [Saccostrea cucullata]|uniref:uncharacterized protein LOC134252300 n=1 Tax=Saccostrea cuccullata TaxID=36930 RepID=UPI002ED02128
MLWCKILLLLLVAMPFKRRCSFEKHFEHGTDNLLDRKHIPAAVRNSAKLYGLRDSRRSICTGCCAFLARSSRKRKSDESEQGGSQGKKSNIPFNDESSDHVNIEVQTGIVCPTLAPSTSSLDAAVQTVPISSCGKEVQTCTSASMLEDNVCQTDFIYDTNVHLLENLQYQIDILNEEIKKKEIVINKLKNEMSGLYNIHNQQDQINFVKEIFCEKSNSLKSNQFDCDVSMLSNISLDEMYEKQAPVVRTLFDCLTQRSQEDESFENRQKRKFRKCLALELLISANNLRYVSPLSFAPLVLLYNSTGSKTAVELFCHTLPSGSYPFLQNWLAKLEPHKNDSDNSVSDLMYAFDNNQRLQKVSKITTHNQNKSKILLKKEINSE